MILVPTWVAVIIVIVGAIVWLAEQPKKAQRRRERREASDRLRQDLAAPPASTQLPYGVTLTQNDADAGQESPPPGQ
jgi:hypothetical protein